MSTYPTKVAEMKHARELVESEMGLPLPDGWFLEMNKRIWIDIVPEQRIVGIWGYRSERLLKLRRVYESIRHRDSKYWFRPVIRDWPEGAEYIWLIRIVHRFIPLAEAMELERRNMPP